MSDISTFSNFKDWAFIILIGGNIATMVNLNRTVIDISKSDAVQESVLTGIRGEIDDLKNEQKEHDREIVKIREYIKPDEIREQRKTVNR